MKVSDDRANTYKSPKRTWAIFYWGRHSSYHRLGIKVEVEINDRSEPAEAHLFQYGIRVTECGVQRAQSFIHPLKELTLFSIYWPIESPAVNIVIQKQRRGENHSLKG